MKIKGTYYDVDTAQATVTTDCKLRVDVYECHGKLVVWLNWEHREGGVSMSIDKDMNYEVTKED